MIEVRELVKTFETTRALDSLNMTVPDGAVYGLIGPNGAGKSTLIRHVTGIYRQNSGELLIDNAPVYENPDIKNRIAYIPDEIPFWVQATIDDLKDFYASCYPSFNEQYYVLLGEQIGQDGKQLVRRLSKGQQKLAAFRIALAQRAKYVILDEPVDGLDPVNRRLIWGLLLANVSEWGTTVLVSSHNLRELEDVCDHVGIMDRGKMVLERSLSELQENIVKVQLVLPEGGSLPQGIKLLHQSAVGQLQQLILRGKAEEVGAQLASAEPIFMDMLPLSLEEIFIYELGGNEHEIRSKLL